MPFWNKFIVNETLSIKENLQQNLAFPLVQEEFLFFYFWDEDLDFHSHDWCLGYGSYKEHQVPFPVIMLFKKSTPCSAIIIRSPARVIHVSLCSGVCIFGSNVQVSVNTVNSSNWYSLLPLISSKYSPQSRSTTLCTYSML
jgi:hypothetical protein